MSMVELAWKCFRCGLTFRDAELASTHKKITGHSVSRARVITA